MTGDVTVIVPVWNRRDLLEPLFRGLRAQTRPAAEILVVDDGSEDDSTALAARLGARVIVMGRHGGFAKAINCGMREVHTPLVAIVNNDVELAPDWLARLAAALSPGVWFVTGKILQAAARDRIDGTYDAICRGATSWRVGHACLDSPAFDEPCPIAIAPMTAALFRIELFEKIGPLDERFESYLEDVDFGIRCALAGYSGCYVPGALAWHQGSATLGPRHPDVIRRIARNQVFLLAKHYSGGMLLRCAWPIAAAQGLWGLAALRHRRGFSWLRGKAEGIRRFSQLRADPPAAGRLSPVLCESERKIRRMQSKTGNELYWSLYFLLTAGGAK